ncbi:hypothetical protein Dda_3255 [Drechslerella dactyloides]|uniref:dolichol kinase n=1 Tax=Drechslerella dactyloides TaxID=74499 RepID=A0AAD6NLC8_DREDA|nr:hypothetical protein Dda_3255 [Drechslerella dactyloides]
MTEPAPNDVEPNPPIIRSRSPHPYHRLSVSAQAPPEILVDGVPADGHSQPDRADRSPTTSAPTSPLQHAHTTLSPNSHPSLSYTPSSVSSLSSSESGTEADDEKDVPHQGGAQYFSKRRTLPAPPPKRRKTGQWEIDEDEQPRLKQDSPDRTDVEGKDADGVQDAALKSPRTGSLGGRKKIVFVRRGLEVSLMVVLVLMVCNQPDVRKELRLWRRELMAFLFTYFAVIGSHPAISNLRKPFTVILPSSLDPSPLLYPMVFPAAIALSLTPYTSLYLASVLVCSLASLPPDVYPRFIANNPNLKYLFTLSPVLASNKIPHEAAEHLLYTPIIHANLVSLGVELLIPSLTTTETRLLATALVQLLDAVSAQMVTLKAILWMTGGALLVGCRTFMQKEIDLERSIVFARSRPWARRRRARKEKINLDNFMGATSSDSDQAAFRAAATDIRRRLPKFLPDELPQNIPTLKLLYAIPVYLILAACIFLWERPYLAQYAFGGIDPFAWSAGYLLSGLPFYQSSLADLGWTDIPGLHITVAPDAEGRLWGPNYRLAVTGYWFLLVTVGIIAVVTLGRGVHVPMEKLGFEIQGPGWLGLAEVARGRAVEVDTRRKVFHGLVVAMFLPTVFLDPPFVATALAVVLGIFLIVDILRATLIPPISKPLSIFLAPYVDGRDLRGPIVVSHVFLHIGCAIPVWLSLSGAVPQLQEPQSPFGADWTAPRRELAMISGIVCVGMGDAAASLIGRRFGRHKWGWSGGKSIEGSVAFMVAVYLGLLLAKVWLIAGNFHAGSGGVNRGGVKMLVHALGMRSLAVFTAKSLAVGGLCSLVEAVITGGNDNVVVPIVLWLAVRGLGV